MLDRSHCRQPFAHEPDNCTCEPFRVFELNPALSAEQRRQDRLMLLAVWLVTFAISLICLAVATHEGMGRAESQFQSEQRV